ncbi:MAG: 6-pyruvoyl tetrahydrobiopterin synthase [Planctomyces sp.]|jgi:6-pyruvoyltetrahydropterin/6-carboxytetrahydropterin synthase|nr:6-pyruvoyl tetrahydrobiopterin synthase [Planctomyces sp.]
MPEFRVRVTKDHLVFSAAHFITFNGNICERLHGHNWRVAVEITGPLDENSYVFDFIALRDATQRLVHELDHKVLLPLQHPTIKVEVGSKEVEAKFEDRRWVFPLEDCALLPIANTTAELLAEWFAKHLCEVVRAWPGQQVKFVQAEVEENFGQWGICKVEV